jgi:hypothetical protein
MAGLARFRLERTRGQDPASALMSLRLPVKNASVSAGLHASQPLTKAKPEVAST